MFADPLEFAIDKAIAVPFGGLKKLRSLNAIQNKEIRIKSAELFLSVLGFFFFLFFIFFLLMERR